ncbi:MAG: hypothetical protein AB1540_14055 [Bdellovibrionota bacterium]
MSFQSTLRKRFFPKTTAALRGPTAILVVGFSLLTLCLSGSSWAVSPRDAKVCVLVVGGQGGKAVSAVRSCDRDNVETLQVTKAFFVEELSTQLNELLEQGLQLVSCQQNMAEYVCILAREPSARSMSGGAVAPQSALSGQSKKK